MSFFHHFADQEPSYAAEDIFKRTVVGEDKGSTCSTAILHSWQIILIFANCAIYTVINKLPCPGNKKGTSLARMF
jgi:hypothetical protein